MSSEMRVRRGGFTLRQKGWLVVGIPVTFQILLLLLLFSIQRSHDREVIETRRSKDVIASSYRILGLLTDAETGVRGYAMTGDPVFADPYHRAIAQLPAELTHLRSLVAASPAVRGSVSFADLERAAQLELEYDRDTINGIEHGRRADVAATASARAGKARMDHFREEMRRFLAREEGITASREQTTLTSRSEINIVLFGGALLTIIFAALAMRFFTRSITRRMGVVVGNMQRFERNQPLEKRVEGSDEIAGFDARFHDMVAALGTADAQWRQAEENLRQFFTVSLEMLCVAGFDGYFKLLNPVWEKELGYPLRDLYSRPFIDFVHPDDRASTEEQAGRLAKGEDVVQFENRYRHADGSYRWLLWNAAAHVESQTIFAAAADVTGRKEIEEALQQRNDALEAANRDLESFTYSVSHDLRSPLRAVDGYARMFEEDYGHALDAEGRRLLGVIRSEARRMGVLIDDLLSFSRLGRQSFTRADVNLAEISAEVIAAKRQKYPDKQIDFRAGVAPLARADRSAIRHVMFNLIANAVKYSKPGQPVHIEFGGRDDGDCRLFWVRDDGIGFDMKYAEKIFGVFQRLHTDAEIEGTGVGLAIVQRIVQRHGGRVWAESEPGTGSTFFFTLPATAMEDEEREAVNA